MHPRLPCFFALALLAALTTACGPDSTATPPPARPDTSMPDTTPAIEPMDTSQPEVIMDSAPPPDAILEDGLQRPDTEEPDTVEPDTVEPDTSEPDVEEIDIIRETGEWECLTFSLELLGEPPFVFGQDLILAIWDVRNICSREWRMRLEHEGDFLALHIQKNGVPWLAYPDCFGRGEPMEIAFAFQVGLRQGWTWTPDNHQLWIDECAAEPFDPNAEYTLVGYAHTEVAAGTLDYSMAVPLAEMPLQLVAP